MRYSYPLDLTGIAETNLIENEPQVITEINGKFSQIIIPDYAPFYLDNLKVTHIAEDGSESILNLDIDYFLAYPYQDLARETGKLAWGAITVIRKDAIGRFKLNYQTIGDKWVADPDYVKNLLLEIAYNPRIAYWDQLTNVQDKFPPQDHTHTLTESDKWPELLAAINRVTQAIADRQINEAMVYPTIVAYLDRYLPELLTKEAVGLGDVQNLSLATDEEVTSLSQVDKYLTLRQVILAIKTSDPSDAANAALEAFDVKLAAITDDVGNTNLRIADSETAISDLNNRLDQTNTVVIELSQSTDQNLLQVNNRITELEQRKVNIFGPTVFGFYLSQS